PAPRDEEPLQPALFAHRARVGVTEAARRDAIDELLAREADWRAEALAILLEWRGVTMKNLVRTADRRAWARLVDLRRQLFELRLAAVTAIQSKNYTEREGQEEVDRRVQAVRDFLGKYGGLRIAPISAGQRELLARIEWIDSRLAGLGVRPQTVPSSITLRRDAPVDFDRLRLDWEPGTTAEQDDATLAWNRKQRTLVSEVEWDAAEALNDYRALLGRPLLRLDEGLCQAARTHAEYMSKRGRLVHVEPDPALAGPWARATHFGFECDREGIGENIVPGRSTGRAAFEAFYRSAPHHRNMIRMHHRSLGTGQAGGWWTWDFGRSKTG
ncbi:MAG: CAP domain-containing protein, partial [Planctomycetes bacterium]|nr:CAP domain-containing protein [Planctomycetota bacterium]